MTLDPNAPLGLRERKKRAARRAMSEAALRLAAEKGVEQVRVEDIASAVGVSSRTFNNYFSSKEEAICSFIVERQERVLEALRERPPEESLWEAVSAATLETYGREGEPNRDSVKLARSMILHPSVHGEFLKAHATVERVLAEGILERAGAGPENALNARLMAAIVESAVKTAFFHWLMNEGTEPFLETVSALLHEAAAGVPSLTGPEPVKKPNKQ
ncbi:TetR family transcriptional regulator [Amycolatopsis sp. MJM2582]|uniref:TetR/AcrR family transcriptional regulator n=1 Tax=Amycolatopsis sp. MJM2582 TaxID=1427749 RepID=UPI00050381BA|nr:TetR/AcrR family transcriptional regulator [Amycolatopsis sp. MJM2582]KFZ81909.1 TetR family transcriptional regulator [Amycolatopsis sp. MJM2582]